MSDYTRRVMDDLLDEFLPDFPAITIDGPKAVGKTATASRRAQTIFRLDQPETAELIRSAPEVLRSSATPVLLDEWQLVPEVWDRVRRLVDEDRTGGRFLLTGSAIPADVQLHSGAGRFVGLRMRPMSWEERTISTPTVRIVELLTGEAEIVGSSSLTLSDYVHEIVGSGFPPARMLGPRARKVWLNQYLERVIHKDFEAQGLRTRQPEMLRHWMRAFAAATATTTSYTRIGLAAGGGDGDPPAKTTVIAYREVLSQLWLLDQVPAWSLGQGLLSKAALAPKHFLADPALSARLMDLDEARLLSADTPAATGGNGSVLGHLFEALVALSLQTYAHASDGTLSHFRNTDGSREVDFILSKGDQAQLAIEVKLKPSVDDRDVRHLLWLKAKMGDRLTDMVVINTGPYAYRRTDGVAVVPLALLGH